MRIFTKKRAKPYNEIGKRLGKSERSADAVEWKQRLSNLLCVKSIVTIMMTTVLALLLLGDYEPPDKLLTLYSTAYGAVMTYYFTRQEEK